MEIGGLSVIVEGRQFADTDDYWDGNWLIVTAAFKTPGSYVTASGPIVHLSELESFLRELRPLHESMNGEATLDCMEPNLHVQVSSTTGGRMRLAVGITPDHLTE